MSKASMRQEITYLREQLRLANEECERVTLQRDRLAQDIERATPFLKAVLGRLETLRRQFVRWRAANHNDSITLDDRERKQAAKSLQAALSILHPDVAVEQPS